MAVCGVRLVGHLDAELAGNGRELFAVVRADALDKVGLVTAEMVKVGRGICFSFRMPRIEAAKLAAIIENDEAVRVTLARLLRFTDANDVIKRDTATKGLGNALFGLCTGRGTSNLGKFACFTKRMGRQVTHKMLYWNLWSSS